MSFVVNLMKRYCATGRVDPKPRGGFRHGKLGRHRVFILRQVETGYDISMPELAALLRQAKGVKAAPATLSRFLIASGLSFKKTLRASEQDRLDIRNRRREWKEARQSRMRAERHRLIFIDETGTTTKLTSLRGRCAKGQRFHSKAPFDHWKTQTLIAGLKSDGLIAPFVIGAPINRTIFEAYVETQLVPLLRSGDAVIMDNLAAHKSPQAEAFIRATGGMGAVPAPLQSRSQPNRNGLRQTQGPSPGHSRANY